MPVRRLILQFVLLFLFSSGLMSQNWINDRVKANYIISFGKFLEWQNEEKLDSFVIGTLGKDTSMYQTLIKLTQKKKIRKKPIAVRHFKKLKEVDGVQILYVERGRCDEISKIYKHITGRNILLVTDSCRNVQESMMNFLPLIFVRLEINQVNLEKEGFTVPSFLAAFAAKFKQDYEELLALTEDSLQKEKEVVNEQKEILRQQGEEIRKKEENIGLLNKKMAEQMAFIAEKELELDNYVDQIDRQKKEYGAKLLLISMQEEKIKKQLESISTYEKKVIQSKAEAEAQQEILNKQKKEIDLQENQISLQKTKISQTTEQLERQKMIRYFISVVSVLFLGIIVFVYYHYRNKKKANNELHQKNLQITQQKEEIESQRDEIESQRDLVVEQRDEIETIHVEITDSIAYARRIQTAILPPLEKLENRFPDSFVVYWPRDVVSGDFYWFAEVEDHFIIAAADCTGHGVPGAFMSVLGISLLREIVMKEYITHTSVILRKLRKEIVRLMNQEGRLGNTKDGMDIAVCSIDLTEKTMQYSGANNPLYYFRNNCLHEIKADKMPVSIHERMDKYSAHDMELLSGDAIYLFSDGYADQFGGPAGKKFKYRPFRELIASVADLPMQEQKMKIETTMTDWMGRHDQVDDILIIGIRIL